MKTETKNPATSLATFCTKLGPTNRCNFLQKIARRARPEAKLHHNFFLQQPTEVAFWSCAPSLGGATPQLQGDLATTTGTDIDPEFMFEHDREIYVDQELDGGWK